MVVCNAMDCYSMSLKIEAILNSMIMHVSFLAIEIEIWKTKVKLWMSGMTRSSDLISILNWLLGLNSLWN